MKKFFLTLTAVVFLTAAAKAIVVNAQDATAETAAVVVANMTNAAMNEVSNMVEGAASAVEEAAAVVEEPAAAGAVMAQ
jgi:hypothetical protein